MSEQVKSSVTAARAMQILADLAKRSPLRMLSGVCEQQKQISTAKLAEYIEQAGDELAGYAFKLRQHNDALRAEAEALRVALLGIASVNPAERGIEWAKSYASDGLKGAGSELYARWLDTFKEAEALRDQNRDLRIEADGWFSRVNGVEDKLEALRAENERLTQCLATANTQAEQFEREWYLRGDDLEVARGLLRDMRHATRIKPSCQAGIVSPCRCVACVDSRTVDFLTATTSPEVPDHIEQHLKMVEQGERQEAIGYGAWNTGTNPGTRLMRYDGMVAISPTKTDFYTVPVYTTPQPGPDVRGLVEALEETSSDLFLQIEAKHGPKAASEYPSIVAAKAAIAANRQAQQGGSHDT